MALERDNAAEHLARIDRLMAETAPTPAEKQTTRPEKRQQTATTNVPALADDKPRA